MKGIWWPTLQVEVPQGYLVEGSSGVFKQDEASVPGDELRELKGSNV